MILRDISQVGLLGQEASNETNGILHRTPFVAVERFAKVRGGAEDFVGPNMLCVFRPIVVSDREPKRGGIATESSSQRHAHGSGTFGF